MNCVSKKGGNWLLVGKEEKSGGGFLQVRGVGEEQMFR